MISEITRQKISESLKGKNTWTKGRKQPKHEKIKQIQAQIGRKLSNETKLKISKKHKGKKLSLEHRKKLSKAHKGKIVSLETRKKISEKNKGKPASNKGILPSIETRKKMSNSHTKGKNHHWWKGGITPENAKIRSSFEIGLFRKACMERDDFTCQKTRQRGGRLVVHHINNFADFPELRTSIENGITLSIESHREFHKIYGKKNNTREQLLEFLNK